MEKLDKAINWPRVEEILMNHYSVGTSSEGADAYPPLLLFKCLMLQKWFRIHSDPELENQIYPLNMFFEHLLKIIRPTYIFNTFEALSHIIIISSKQFNGAGNPEDCHRIGWLTPYKCSSGFNRAWDALGEQKLGKSPQNEQPAGLI